MILDSSIRQNIVEIQKDLDAKGKLYSKSKLAELRDTFRGRFGPVKLRNLDGEALLVTMHDHGNRDSLVYWLEFKSDDEFPACFGSIAGGSALKFGIYKRSDTGIWMTGSPINQRELTIEEAIEVARKHRDQLIKGAEIIERFSLNGTDADYKNLQDDLHKTAPDVSDMAWGHKYFCLLFPDKLDDYHNPDYQKFHLIKLFQVPPPGEGRYLAAGRFIAIARELDLPVNTLTAILNHREGNPYWYWRVGTSDGKVRRNKWDMMREGDFVAIGWEISDLSNISRNKESKETIRKLVGERYPGPPQRIGKDVQQIFNFVANLSERDLVLAADGATILGIGKVTGEYSYDSSSDFPHRRPVKWLNLGEWKLPTDVGLQTSVHKLKYDPHNFIEIERRIFSSPSRTPTEVITTKVPPLGSISGRIQSILARKNQVILYGPPGTGKTYWAEIAARELAARSAFGKSYEQLQQDQMQSISGSGEGSHSLVRMCCFHPAYGYEDFLEGYRPQSIDGRMIFQLRDGIFKTICKDAQMNPERNYYLIIDEINRGDIPRIFGELLTILEKDKRGRSIIMPLSGERFWIPRNVFVIGTMNTADRSIALLDTALRRRFGFVELMPDSSVLGDAVVSGIPIGRWLDDLNRRICTHVGRDSRNLQVGHSYMMEGGKPISEFHKFSRVIREDIIPLLEEYCYEDYSALEKILGNGLVDTANQIIRHDLFGDGGQDGLVRALLQPCPGIATSPQVVEAESKVPEEEAEEVEGGEPSGAR